jgi:tetratricopeptide (TPR) repeat protein
LPILRITTTGAYVETTSKGNGRTYSERRPFSFKISPQDEEDIRWYLEDYRICPVAPAPKFARRIEQRLAEVGCELFRQVLAGSNAWEQVRHRLGDTRIEVETEAGDALVPWGLIRDPVADMPLALEAGSFVRCHSRPAVCPNPTTAAAGNLGLFNKWWDAVIRCMQGLGLLYRHTGRSADWSRLVGEIVPCFVDPANDGPLPGREELWGLVTEYRVRLALQSRRLEEGERLQSALVGWNRHRVAAIVARPPQTWDEKNSVRTLAGSLAQRADIQRERGSAACVKGYMEAVSLAEQIADTQSIAHFVYNLGHAYLTVAEIRDIALAERWYRRSLELCTKEDRIGRGNCLGQLGSVAYARYREARRGGRSPAELTDHLSNAERYNLEALDICPDTAVRELAATHNQLGIIYAEARQMDAALRHFRQSILYHEAAQDRFGAGKTRYNAANILSRADRLNDAREWARSALGDFEDCEGAEQDAVKTLTLKLLEKIESELRASSPPY